MRNSFSGDLQIAWDSTSLSDFKICPRKYQYTILEGWRRKSDSIHLRFGLEFHEVIADYEACKAQGQAHDEAVFHSIRALLERTGDYPTENDVVLMAGGAKAKTKENLVRTAVWYLDTYNPDPAVTLILENGDPAVEVSFNFDVNERFILCGHLDRIVKYQDSPFVIDHKTTTFDLTGWWYDRFDPDNQMSLYSIAGQVVLHSPIRGIIIDGIKVDEGGAPQFGRGFTYRTQEHHAEWLSDLNDIFERAERYSNAGHWPMNDTACDKYGGCPFRNVCSKSPSVRRVYLEADFKQLPEEERWNPLTPRISTIPSKNDEPSLSTQGLRVVS